MSLHTHPNFRSCCPNIIDATDMQNLIGSALEFQHMFNRNILPSEEGKWTGTTKQDFKIQLSCISRLYYINYFEDEFHYHFELVARMEYEKRDMYVHFVANFCHEPLIHFCLGSMFWGEDANLFMKVILTDEMPKILIYQSLRDDGIPFEVITKFEAYDNFHADAPPSLLYMCYLCMYKQSIHYDECDLPLHVAESLSRFIKTLAAKDAFNMRTYK